MLESNWVTLLTLLGSTGSIGTSTLDVVRRWPERFGIYALVAGRNIKLLAEQIAQFRPKVAVVADEKALQALVAELKARGITAPELACGSQAKVQVATASEASFVMSAIVGVEGLEATYEAVKLGKRVGLANKEVLVASGQLVMEAVNPPRTAVVLRARASLLRLRIHALVRDVARAFQRRKMHNTAVRPLSPRLTRTETNMYRSRHTCLAKPFG